MVFQPFIDFITWLLELLIDKLDTVELVIPDRVYSAMDILFSSIGYLFPVKALLPLLVVSGVLGVSRLVVAIIVRIKSFIPTMGD